MQWVQNKKTKFPRFASFLFCFIPKTENFGNIRKFFFTRNFDSNCKSEIRNDKKNEPRQKPEGYAVVLEGKRKFSEVSDFSILPYT